MPARVTSPVHSMPSWKLVSRSSQLPENWAVTRDLGPGRAAVGVELGGDR